VRADELDGIGRRRRLQADLHGRVAVVEAGQDRRQQVRRGCRGGGDRKHARLRLGVGRKRPARVREQGLGAQHELGEHLARRRQRRALSPARDQPPPDLGLQQRQMLGDRRLAHIQLLGGAGQRSAAGDRREGTEPRLELHNLTLYEMRATCI
jgi:hypothetical protein